MRIPLEGVFSGYTKLGVPHNPWPNVTDMRKAFSPSIKKKAHRSWIFLNVFEIEKNVYMVIAWLESTNLLDQTIFFLHYYLNRYDGQV